MVLYGRNPVREAIRGPRTVHRIWATAAAREEAWLEGADAAVEAQETYDEVDYSGRAVLVLGSEGRGLRPRVAAACDLLVAIPLRGQVASLNVSAAAAVMIYAATST